MTNTKAAQNAAEKAAREQAHRQKIVESCRQIEANLAALRSSRQAGDLRPPP